MQIRWTEFNSAHSVCCCCAVSDDDDDDDDHDGCSWTAQHPLRYFILPWSLFPLKVIMIVVAVLMNFMGKPELLARLDGGARKKKRRYCLPTDCSIHIHSVVVLKLLLLLLLRFPNRSIFSRRAWNGDGGVDGGYKNKMGYGGVLV